MQLLPLELKLKAQNLGQNSSGPSTSFMDGKEAVYTG